MRVVAYDVLPRTSGWLLRARSNGTVVQTSRVDETKHGFTWRCMEYCRKKSSDELTVLLSVRDDRGGVLSLRTFKAGVSSMSV